MWGSSEAGRGGTRKSGSVGERKRERERERERSIIGYMGEFPVHSTGQSGNIMTMLISPFHHSSDFTEYPVTCHCLPRYEPYVEIFGSRQSILHSN